MLANVTDVTPVQLAGFLGCLFFLVALINACLKLVDRLKQKPAPADVRAEAVSTFASKLELKDHVLQDLQEHSNLWSKLGGMERGLKQEIDVKVGGLTKELGEMERRINAMDEERTHALHDRINDILAAVSELAGKVNAKR